MNLLLNVFPAYLPNQWIEPEIIDLLQGRISTSVFVHHYYRPDINEIITKRIRPVLKELMMEFKGYIFATLHRVFKE
jgi:hypothetical protein